MSCHPKEGPLRRNAGWLAALEGPALVWLAARTPAWLSPNGLTFLGFLGAVLTLIGYLLTQAHPAGLAVVNLGILVNWFGDSLDGHVARVRGQARPLYGLFLDQSVDVISQALFALGLALSGYLRPEIVAFGFASYLMMTVQSLLRAQITGVFELATAGVGLTEVRAVFFIANIAFLIVPPRSIAIGFPGLTYADIGGLFWIAVHVCLYLVQMSLQLRSLSQRDRPGGSEPGNQG
jgi:archaetidylinositol phosphate synthase